ncbi:hypothetical protein RSAG8_10490, partial [Rhizoctonia solani AG-8 WAC10335]
MCQRDYGKRRSAAGRSQRAGVKCFGHILLVGGFGDSPFLRREFQKRYERQGCRVILPNESTSRAVADGAVLWYASLRVISRAPRSSFGIETSVAFDRDDPSHQDRTHIPSTLGWVVVPGRWNCLVGKGIVISEDAVARVPFSMEFSTPSPNLGKFELELYSYSGNDEPVWMRDKQGKLLQGFCKVAHLQIDQKCICGTLESRTSAGIRYWRLEFEICMLFGRTELEAYMEWEREGYMRTGPCTILPVFEEA